MEPGKKISRSHILLYIVIAALGLSTAYLANITIRLERDCAVNKTKWDTCEQNLENYKGQTTNYAVTKDNQHILEKVSAVNATKWGTCENNYEECQKKTNEQSGAIKQLQDKLDTKQTEFHALELKCKVDETYLGIKNNEEKKDLEEIKNHQKDRDAMNTVKGALEQHILDLEGQVEELEDKNSKLEAQLRSLIEVQENTSRQEKVQQHNNNEI